MDKIAVSNKIPFEATDLDFSVEKNISPYTKAIMSIDIAGQSADMEKLTQISKKYNLKIISDTAQAPGALYKNQYAGTMSDVGGYSLNYHKHIHTGEGGILVTNDDEIAKKAFYLSTQAKDDPKLYIHNHVGYNFRLTNIQAAVGLAQLELLESKLKKKKEIHLQYKKKIATILSIS